MNIPKKIIGNILNDKVSKNRNTNLYLSSLNAMKANTIRNMINENFGIPESETINMSKPALMNLYRNLTLKRKDEWLKDNKKSC